MSVALHTRIRPQHRWTAAQWGFAAIAIALHVGLLLLPLRTDVRTPRPGVLELELFRTPKTSPPPEDPGEPVALEPVATVKAAPGMARTEVIPEPGMEPPFGPIVSAETLRSQLESLELPPGATRAHRLGVPRVEALPQHWTRPLIPRQSGPFENLFAPSETEVLDQWQDPDGTRRVVMRTPSGHTLCGRLEPWNPLNPLYEPVPMYHLCGGGGRR